MWFHISFLAMLLCSDWILHQSLAIIGYDCGSSAMNITTLSLLEVGECDLPQKSINVSQTYIQLLQITEYSETSVLQCKVELHRTIHYCGMNSHVSVVKNGINEYVVEVTRDTCQRMHDGGTLTHSNNYIHGLRVNETTTRSLTLAGSVSTDGSCNGAAYSDPYGTWDSVVVQAIMKITLQSYTARVNLATNNLHLRTGTICPLSNSNCIDIEGGYTFWEAIPVDSCQFNRYSILFEGPASKIVDEFDEYPQTVYSLATDEITFALASKSRTMICGYALIRTEHPKLVIFETRSGDNFIFKKRQMVANLDIFSYVNSKFVYVEKHVRTQMKQLYHDILIQRCTLERQTLKNSLAIATQAPDEFAFHLMKGPGYMAVVAGEVVHIIKCIPVEVRLRRTTECYSQLPVTRNNETYFLTPRTHILLQKGLQINCNPLLPPFYLLESSWYKFSPSPSETLPPSIIKPLTRHTWKYVNPASLATSGIYTESDLNQLREHIMFPIERPAVLNSVARGIIGEPVVYQGGSITNLLDEMTLERLAVSAWERAWKKFVVFGTVSAGLIGVLLLLRIVKFAADTLIHGYALHSAYGWSLYLVGAIWDSVTHLLLHLSRVPSTEIERDCEEIKPKNEPEIPNIYPDLKQSSNETTNFTAAKNHLSIV